MAAASMATARVRWRESLGGSPACLADRYNDPCGRHATIVCTPDTNDHRRQVKVMDGRRDAIMTFNKILRIPKHPPRADKSGLAMHVKIPPRGIIRHVSAMRLLWRDETVSVVSVVSVPRTASQTASRVSLMQGGDGVNFGIKLVKFCLFFCC